MVFEANDTKYGLAYGVYTSNIENAMKFAGDIRVSYAWINSYFNIASSFPFRGFTEKVRGCELCLVNLKEYTQLKGISIVGKNCSYLYFEKR